MLGIAHCEEVQVSTGFVPRRPQSEPTRASDLDHDDAYVGPYVLFAAGSHWEGFTCEGRV